MKNIIVLIIASDNEKYIKMQDIWRKYMNNHPNIKSFFIKNDPTITEDVMLNENENTIYSKNIETYIHGILSKTLNAINYCFNNFDFDYIYRTNLSSMIELNKLYKYISTTDPFHYGAVIGNYNGILFGSGSGFFLSKEACIYLLINHRRLSDECIADDVCIGILLEPIYGIKPIRRCNIESLCDDNYVIEDDLFHYRCKFDNDHSLTIDIMQKLYNKLYI